MFVTFKIWHDPFLKWDPSEYNGVDLIRMPVNTAFEHDIQLLNNADDRLQNVRKPLKLVYNHGENTWVPSSLFQSSCLVDLKVFPFDVQNCSLSFGSLAYDNTALDLDFDTDGKIDLNDYQESKEWSLDKKALYGVKSFRTIDNKNYSVLTYYLILRRNSVFFEYLLLYPCILLAILTLVVFWLPPETPSKIILGMSIFASFFLLLLLLADIVPTSLNNVPYIGILFLFSMIMVASSLFLCTFVVHVYFRADTFFRAPKLVKKILLEWLAKVLMMQTNKSQASVTELTLLNSGLLLGGKNVPNADKFEKFELLKERFKSYRENVLKVGFQNLLNSHPAALAAAAAAAAANPDNNNNASSTGAVTGSCLNLNRQMSNSTANMLAAGCGGGGAGGADHLQQRKPNCTCPYCIYCAQQQSILTEIAYLNNLERDIKEIRDYLRDTRKKLETKELKAKLANEWKQIALVLDRTFFFVYLVITILLIYLVIYFKYTS